MPAIFNQENKSIYEQRLLETGLELIKQNGLKGLRIEDIARKTGFAKSTFYTFFSSKEEFVCKIPPYVREKHKEATLQLFQESQKMSKAAAKQFFNVQFLSDANIYPYLSKEDYEYLRARCPELYHLDPKSDEENTKWLLDKMDTKKACDWKLFSNYVKAIVTVTMNPENLYSNLYKETIELMIDGLVDFIFE